MVHSHCFSISLSHSHTRAPTLACLSFSKRLTFAVSMSGTRNNDYVRCSYVVAGNWMLRNKKPTYTCTHHFSKGSTFGGNMWFTSAAFHRKYGCVAFLSVCRRVPHSSNVKHIHLVIALLLLLLIWILFSVIFTLALFESAFAIHWVQYTAHMLHYTWSTLWPHNCTQTPNHFHHYLPTRWPHSNGPNSWLDGEGGGRQYFGLLFMLGWDTANFMFAEMPALLLYLVAASISSVLFSLFKLSSIDVALSVFCVRFFLSFYPITTATDQKLHSRTHTSTVSIYL